MLINFSNEGLTSYITCDCVCSDTYDVTNLISLNPEKRSRGFLAGNFVRPPVNITLTLLCDVNISHIVINARVGLQKSSAVQVFMSRGNNDKVSVAVGNAAADTDVMEFHIHGVKKNANCHYFSSSSKLKNISTVELRIFKTEGSTIPALRKLEIWGWISSKVADRISRKILGLWKSVSESAFSGSVKEGSTKALACEKAKDCVKKGEKIIKENVISVNSIPEDFIDPITCDIMVIPMTLPSGKIVDLSTIERFCKNEEEHGRGKSDPFTGILFTDASGPIVASSLKARLDKFLLENSEKEEFKTIPRTVGRKMPVGPNVSKKLSNCDVAGHSEYVNSIPGPSSVITRIPTQTREKDIDFLLDSSLSGLPSFIEKIEVKKTKLSCIKCSGLAVLFILPCEHLMCRRCLCEMRNSKSDACSSCKKTFSFKDVTRFHTELSIEI